MQILKQQNPKKNLGMGTTLLQYHDKKKSLD